MEITQQDDRAKIIPWVPVALWAALIFYFSTDAGSFPNTAGILGTLLYAFYPGITADQLETINLIVRKGGHWAEYFVLALLILRALRTGSPPGRHGRHMVLTMALVILYAFSDEFHQSYVPSRTSSIGDVMIDSFGGLCGALWMNLYLTHSRRLHRPIQKT